MLPNCPIVATRPSDYPFPRALRLGVVCKLAQALGVDVAPYLDLVALATIADVVPLLDENRSLAIAGLRSLARTQRPGLQALMRNAQVDPAAVDAGAVGFRLAPRINAAGRLGRPDAALELLLTTDADEAKRLADELETLNRDRQAVEDKILRAAVAEVESWPEQKRRRRGYVIWGEDWHEGVIGIVASRLVERFNRPVVLIAGADGNWKGSGRSLPAFDLHGALGACAQHLQRFGGHRAAAGLDRAGRARCVRGRLRRARGHRPRRGRPRTRDGSAIVPGSALTIGLASELERLAPFGLGNPDVLLVPACETVQPGAVGDGKHLRFRIRQSGRDAGSACAIAFGLGPQLSASNRAGRRNIACRLKENRWNGTIAPRLVVRRLFDTHRPATRSCEHIGLLWKAGEDAWTSEARGSSPSCRLAGGARRQLYESEAFRTLLAGTSLELPRAARAVGRGGRSRQARPASVRASVPCGLDGGVREAWKAWVLCPNGHSCGEFTAARGRVH